MSDSVCPICGNQYTSGGVCECWPKCNNPSYIPADFPAEISRLKAALEKAEREREENAQNSADWERLANEWETISIEFMSQRDEAYSAIARQEIATADMVAEEANTAYERDEARRWAIYYRWHYLKIYNG